MAGTRVEETTGGCSPACDHDGGIETVMDDLPADVLGIVLRCLDGASLAAAGCASAGFRELANDPDAWRALCLQMWPSLRQVVSCGGDGGYRALYADAFPFPAASPAVSSSLPARLVSAVDRCIGDQQHEEHGGVVAIVSSMRNVAAWSPHASPTMSPPASSAPRP
uniref:F-box domain-containing protein n=1 Tax=Aegilops tauschii subsp. strangulata TaxID=200361 RepID=A0A453K9I9_AEGTS